MVKLYRYWRKGYYGLLGKWGIIKWIQDISRRKKWQGTVFVVVWLGSIPTKTVSLGLGSLLLLLSCLLPNHRRCTFTRRKKSLWEASPTYFVPDSCAHPILLLIHNEMINLSVMHSHYSVIIAAAYEPKQANPDLLKTNSLTNTSPFLKSLKSLIFPSSCIT